MMALQIFSEWLASFVEVLLYFYIIDSISDRRFDKKKQVRFWLIFAGVIALGIVMMNLIELSMYLPTVTYAVIVYALGARFLFLGKFPDYLFASIGYIAFIAGVDMMFIATLNRAGMTEITQQILSDFNSKRIFFIAAGKAVDIAIVMPFGKLLSNKAIHIRNRGFIVTVICLILGGVGSTYYGIHSEIIFGFRLNFYQILLSLSCVLVVGIAYLYLRVQEIRREAEYTDRRNQLLEINYRLAKEAYESNAKLYHDMRNHFLVIQNYLAEKHILEAQEYLKKLVGEHKIYCVERWTGIEAIDYILSQKTEMAGKKGIKTHIHSEYPKDCGIDPVDLCTILTNLFDNAIEACEKCPQDVKKEISLTIRRIHQFIIIRVENSSISAPVIKNGIPHTSKTDIHKHGWGLQNVKDATEKYGGTIECDYHDAVFTISIMLFY